MNRGGGEVLRERDRVGGRRGQSRRSLLGWVCVDSIFLLQQLQLFLLLLGVHLLEGLGTTYKMASVSASEDASGVVFAAYRAEV